MEQKELSVKLGRFTLTFSEQDRLGAVIYRQYLNQITDWLRQYRKSLDWESKAVGKVRLATIKASLTANNKSIAEKEEVAEKFFDLVNDYYGKHGEEDHAELPSVFICDVQKKFEFDMGINVILDIDKNSKYDFSSLNLSERTENFKNLYYHKRYSLIHNYEKELSYDDYLNKRTSSGTYSDVTFNEIIQEYFEDKDVYSIWDAFDKEDRFGRYDHLDKDVVHIKEALKEIDWRQEYLKNPHSNSLLWNFWRICHTAILLQTLYLMRALRLTDNLSYYKVETYQSCVEKIGLIKNEKTSDKKALIVDALRTFPFEEVLYEHLLNEFGDADGVATSLADFFDIDLESIKKELLAEYEAALPVAGDDDEDEILRQFVEIQTKKEFYAYKASVDKESELRKKWNDLDKRLRTVKGKEYDTREEAVAAKKEMLHQSREPWVIVKEIICDGMILPELKDKFKYWDFDGLKKNYPSLLKYERPVLFLKMSLFGWGEYFVLTNRRVMHITKNDQASYVIDDKTEIDYENGELMFHNADKSDALGIKLKYPESSVRHLLDELCLLVHTLRELDETLFEVPENFSQSKDNQSSTGKLFSNRGKGIFGDRKKQTSAKVQEKRMPDAVVDKQQMDASGYTFCTQCGTPIKSTDKFCSKCGNKLQ